MGGGPRAVLEAVVKRKILSTLFNRIQLNLVLGSGGGVNSIDICIGSH